MVLIPAKAKETGTGVESGIAKGPTTPSEVPPVSNASIVAESAKPSNALKLKSTVSTNAS